MTIDQGASPRGDLVEQAEGFAETLAGVLDASVSPDCRFVVTPYEGRELAWVHPQGSDLQRAELIPIAPTGAPVGLWLKVAYQVRLDDRQEHLAVTTSVLSLLVDAESKPRPAIRIEYDRDRGNEPDDPKAGGSKRAAAHVQIHGSSTELGYAAAASGGPVRSLEKYHIPVGGRRFRPSLEDFIEFLAVEELIPSPREGWKRALAQSRQDWLRLQLRAAVRNDPEVAAAQLRREGYTVTPPADP